MTRILFQICGGGDDNDDVDVVGDGGGFDRPPRNEDSLTTRAFVLDHLDVRLLVL